MCPRVWPTRVHPEVVSRTCTNRREKRREALSRFALKVANDVLESGQPRVLEPMNSADRKIVHDTLVEFAGIATRSQGQDPHRRVVVALADDQPEEA